MKTIEELANERDELLRNHKDSIGAQARIWEHFIEQSHAILFGKQSAMAINHESKRSST